ncbi:hypothetical protein [Phenylobacterium sp. 58.2.17]|uniref:hypothetical protein n=1 Tax=Phenylobacterium sp. 58.2.17 TaxID=2969306 RepID=UPI002264D410|nr:hypothetical protein [Phenylobacterium sp. 58.2.17]MCX7586123.1 hypothetical protein [Phenylobacterium sp. 58.2.17]
MSDRITEVWDRGKAAVVGVESLARAAEGDLFRTHATLFVRGAGGFRGEQGRSTLEGDAGQRGSLRDSC